MDPHIKRKWILGEELTPEEKKALSQRPEREYGEPENFNIDRVAGSTIYANREEQSKYGTRVDVARGKDMVPYWVTESWCNANMLRVDEAYKIDTFGEKTMNVRKVKDASELDEIAKGMKLHMRRILGG